MSFERLNNGGNNKFPLTNYGPSDVQELAKYGASIGQDNQDTYKIEVIVAAGDVVGTGLFDSSIVSVIPKGFIVEGVKVDAIETFDAIINVSAADKATGTELIPSGLYTGTPTVGTTEDGIVLAPLTEVLTEDAFIVLTAATATVGKAKVVVTIRNAVADID